MKRKRMTRALSAIVALGMSIGLVKMPVFAQEVSDLPAPIYSLDFSGYSSSAEDQAKGIVGTGVNATITANSEYLNGVTEKTSPDSQISYLEFDVPEIGDDLQLKYGVKVDFDTVIAQNEEGKADEMTVEFWMNIPGDNLTGKYASYFRFFNTGSAKEDLFKLANLDISRDRFEINKGHYTGFYCTDYYDKWTHFVVSQSAVASATEGKAADYTIQMYVDGVKMTGNRQSYDTWYPAVNSLMLGVNSQIDGLDEGTQKFKLSGFNVYDEVLTEDQAVKLYDDSKDAYLVKAEQSLMLDSVNTKNAMAEENASIALNFNNYITSVNDGDVMLTDFEGNEVDIQIETSTTEKKLLLKPIAGSFEAGGYNLKLSKELESFNGHKFGEDKTVKFSLDGDLLFSLGIGDNGAYSFMGASKITQNATVKTLNNSTSADDKIPYLQYGENGTQDTVLIELEEAISATDMGNATVELWMYLPSANGVKYYKTFEMLDANNSYQLQMERMDTDGRVAFNPGNNSSVFLNKLGVLDQWMHIVVQQTTDITDETGDAADAKETVNKVYVNGGNFIRGYGAGSVKTLKDVTKIRLGGTNGIQSMKLATFNVYKGVKDPAELYNERKADFTAVLEESLEFEGVDKTFDINAPSIVVNFNNYVEAVEDDQVVLVDNEGNVIEAEVTADGKKLVVKPQTIAYGDYVLKIDEGLESFNGYSLGEDIAVKIRIDKDGILDKSPIYSLDFSSYDAGIADSSKGITQRGSAADLATLTTGNISESGMLKSSPTQQIGYVELNPAIGNQGIKVDFAEGILGNDSAKLGDATIEFWANVPGPATTGKYYQYFGFYDANNTLAQTSRAFWMENLSLDVLGRLSIGSTNLNNLFMGNADVWGGTAVSNVGVIDSFDKWTHFVITQKADANSADSTKANYTNELYVNGNFIYDKTAEAKDWYNAVKAIYLGMNSSGEQKFKISNVNIYDRVLTSEDASECYEETKKLYTAPQESLEYKGIDASEACAKEASIAVKFNNYIENVENSQVSLKDSEGNIVPVTASPDGLNLVLKPESGNFAEGIYELALSADLTSFNNYTLGEEVVVEFKISDGLVFALDLSDASEDGTGISDLTQRTNVEFSSTANVKKEYDAWGNPLFNYLELNARSEDSNAQTGVMNAELGDSINSDNLTVEMWINVASTTSTETIDNWVGTNNKYAKLFNLSPSDSNSKVMHMEAIGQSVNRWTISPGDGSIFYVKNNKYDFTDEYAHVVITREYSYDESNAEKPHKYTVTGYINGTWVGTVKSENVSEKLGTIGKINIGDINDGGSVDAKIHTFNIYEGIKNEAWASEKYESGAAAFEGVVINGDVYTNFEVTKDAEDNNDATLDINVIYDEECAGKIYYGIIAAYDAKGRLVGAVMSDKKTIIDGENKISFTYEDIPSGATYVKPFAWCDGITPMSESIEKTIN